MSQNHDDELTEALTAGALDTLAEQAHQFHTAIATGQIDFDPGSPGQGIPPVLSGMHGRRARTTHTDELPQDAQFSAWQSLVWVSEHEPDLPVLLTPSQTGMTYATYALPGRITVSHLLPMDAHPRDGAVVTAASLITSGATGLPSDGNPLLPPGLAWNLEALEGAAPTRVRQVPTPEQVRPRQALRLPDNLTWYTHQLIPGPDTTATLEIPVTHADTDQPRQLRVPAHLLSTIGWLDCFGLPEVDNYEEVFAAQTGGTLYLWAFKTAFRVPAS